jgi:hypothetical protein
VGLRDELLNSDLSNPLTEVRLLRECYLAQGLLDYLSPIDFANLSIRGIQEAFRPFYDTPIAQPIDPNILTPSRLASKTLESWPKGMERAQRTPADLRNL